MDTASEIGQPRSNCARCGRPEKVCYCEHLPHLPTQTKVLLLQHPRERGKAVGTAKMASLCLPNSTLLVGKDWGESQALQHALGDPAYPPVLLYPGATAKDILRDPPTGPITLVVVDGTWSQAKTLVRDNPVLAQLPRYAFRAPTPSEYRIRREPSDEVVSTIEALMHVLGALEGDPARFTALLRPFRAMVEAQLSFQGGARERKRKQRKRAIPEPVQRMREQWDRLVCVVGEFNAWPLRLGRRKEEEELVQWVMARPSTGELVNLVVAPTYEISPTTPQNSGLSVELLRAAPHRSLLLAGFSKFVRPNDIVCSWGRYMLDSLRAAPDAEGAACLQLPTFDLRTLYTHYAKRKFGTLEKFAEHQGIAMPQNPSRALRRMELLLHAAHVLRQPWPNE